MGDWISTQEASQLSGYNPHYLRRLMRGKLIAADKKGNTWWIDRKSLLAYIKAAQSADDGRFGAKNTTENEKEA